MVKITWNVLAFEDLEEISEYISQDSSIYAIRIVEKIHEKVSMLIDFPKSGRIVPEFNDQNVRELIEGNYRIVYWVKNSKEVIILRVHHSSRLLK